jgi:hypothetical protein
MRPARFFAYVGTGQVTPLTAIEAIGKPDPKNVGQYFGSSRPILRSKHPCFFND